MPSAPASLRSALHGHNGPLGLRHAFLPGAAAIEAAKRIPASVDIDHIRPISADTAEMVRSVINLVGDIIQKEKVDMSAIKALQLVDMGVADAMEHGGQPREQHLQSLVRLVGK